MAKNKLASELMDAYMVGDKALIAKLKAKLDDRFNASIKDTSITPIRTDNILTDDNARSSDVYNFMNKTLGTDWWELEIETIDRLLWIDFGFVLDDTNRDKVLAMRHLSNSNLAFSDWYEFNQIAIALAGGALSFEVVISPTPGMIISSIDMMRKIRPGEEFSSEVRKYITILMITEGIYTVPPSLLWMKDEFEDMITDESRANKGDTYTSYMNMIKNKNYEHKETSADIQAGRLMRAESAAVVY